MAFGLTSSPMYKWLKYSRCVLLYVLQHHPFARISLPTEEEVNLYILAIGKIYKALANERVWAAADGLKTPLQKSVDWAIQNRYYNGWQGSTYVNSVSGSVLSMHREPSMIA